MSMVERTPLAALAALLLLAACEPSGQAPQRQAPPAHEPVPTDNAAVPPAAKPPTAPAKASPCLEQDGEALDPARLRAIGTEPFWGARIEGRCVTYSTPDDQSGTRVWTRFTGTPDKGIWAGALGGKRFELRTRPEPRCSDGMSDNVYPIAVDLLVAGEQRTGCAEPAATGR